MIQINDIIEYNNKEYRCWFMEDLSGNNFNNTNFDSDNIYLHLLNIDDSNDGICITYSIINNNNSQLYVDYLVDVTSPKTFDNNSI